ncbi:hypothetical protein CJ030_MR0G006563 [Morella rubra]|uniref:Uncharacterized protein n=1 Tax=Morella rubra TaxID=262757 RepID=A0A6A1ULM6_9ROSI|nr:hypothetical protein CJ030_MR0G006563 [Morella rubra]
MSSPRFREISPLLQGPVEMENYIFNLTSLYQHLLRHSGRDVVLFSFMLSIGMYLIDFRLNASLTNSVRFVSQDPFSLSHTVETAAMPFEDTAINLICCEELAATPFEDIEALLICCDAVSSDGRKTRSDCF